MDLGGLHRVEEDLPVGLFDQRVNAAPVSICTTSAAPWQLIADCGGVAGQIADPGVLCGEGIRLKRQGHGGAG